jgi:hypothetical protein
VLVPRVVAHDVIALLAAIAGTAQADPPRRRRRRG